ncbi:helix-turn-helix domain-containing protein [Stackebrandtia soli]|uniref:helix-turn-helix domain-containing protein n=1 Tax=Stackebrandtia soli TaxID=1892856 RepID=UPI0039EB4EED
MVLLRRVIGETLRSRRRAQQRTLRDVSASANVSLGYLSEIERGHKEASSELLSSICDALDVRLSEVLGDVTTTVAKEEGAVVAPAELRDRVGALVGMHDLGKPGEAFTAPKPSTAPQQENRPVSAPTSLAAVRARRARPGSHRSANPKASVAA